MWLLIQVDPERGRVELQVVRRKETQANQGTREREDKAGRGRKKKALGSLINLINVKRVENYKWKYIKSDRSEDVRFLLLA